MQCMEYEILQKIQAVPRWIRIIFGIFFLTGGILAAILPLIPGAIGIPIGLILLVSARKVETVRKMRRGFQHLLMNLSWQRFKQKMYDMKTHIKHILFRNK